MPFTLEGRTALVTGSARGIGRAIAERLLSAGANVMLNDLDESALLETEAALRNSDDTHPRVRHFAGDLTDPATPSALVEATLNAFGAIDIIVNNAGYTWDSVIQKTTDDQFQAMLDIHLVTPFRILRAASEYLRSAAKRESAHHQRVMRKVVNITSIAGTDGNPGQSAYGSAKAGVIGLTRTLAKEWGRYNVNVNAVGFGLIETRLVVRSSSGLVAQGFSPGSQAGPGRPDEKALASGLPGADAPAESTLHMHGHDIKIGVPTAALDALKERCPLGRLGTPEEAANAVLFFCSPLSDYVTGEVLICGGGLHF
jgi:3-oxoacyl-[acyl-carrier protein] reductase